MNDIIIDISNRKEICSACGKEFILRASYQTIDAEKGVYVCSMRCKNSLAERSFKRETCINCNKSFFVEHSYQQIKIGETSLYFCSLNCKNEATAAITVSNTREKPSKVRKIAIFTQKEITQSGHLDGDADGLSKSAELAHHTNLKEKDSDKDGYADGLEVAAGFSPSLAEEKLPQGTLVKSQGKPEVYQLTDGKKRHINNEQTFLAHGWLWSQIIIVSERFLGTLKEGFVIR